VAQHGEQEAVVAAEAPVLVFAAPAFDVAAQAYAALTLSPEEGALLLPPYLRAIVATEPAPEPEPEPEPEPVVTWKECCVCLEDVEMEHLMLVMPCGHRCACTVCADALLAKPPASRLCPKCRAFIIGVTLVYDE
jgi:hypothetical protein